MKKSDSVTKLSLTNPNIFPSSPKEAFFSRTELEYNESSICVNKNSSRSSIYKVITTYIPIID